MSVAITDRRPSHTLQGCYLSGTATLGNWMCWSTNQTFNDEAWYAEKSPANILDWAKGAYLFAGVVMQDAPFTGDEQGDGSLPDGHVITLISDGYAPKAYVYSNAGCGAGVALGFGGAAGVAQDLYSEGTEPPSFMIGVGLESLSTGDTGRMKVLLRDFR